MNTRHLGIALWLLVAAVATGCRHRDFCQHHWDHAPKARLNIRATYRIAWEIPAETPYADWRADWPAVLDFGYDDLLPGTPEGLRVWTFPPTLEPYSNNLPPHGGEISFLEEGEHALLLYNNDTEAIRFDDMDSWITSKATTRTRFRSTYGGNPYYTPQSRSERTITTPDMVYGAYVPSYQALMLQGPTPDIEVELQPLVFTYVVIHEFDQGLEHVAYARGALAGMAEGVWLHSGESTLEAATLLYDCDVTPAAVVAQVQSFGIPGYPKPEYSRSDGQYALNLEVLLRNGKMKSFDFDISAQVAAQPRGGVIRVSGIKIDPKDADASGSGFQVDVNGWGEEEDLQM